MTHVRLRSRAASRRLAFINAYQFPASVRLRFAGHHEALSAEKVSTVEAATRQWFRLAARQPKARLAMPSMIVDDMWHELVLHTRDYEQFCQTAFVSFLHHTPESAVSAESAAANRVAGLAMTYRLAQQDEGGAPGGLPLLFRVDQELNIGGGRRYLADCGGRGQCHDMPGGHCLQHLRGPGRWHRTHRRQPIEPNYAGVYPAGPAGGGNGCVGGGG
ncbi:hypothetical protein [Paractinoplanes rishiriensis]|nr:hypothetical protein [Actinoplanes rishiriensis]